MPAFLPAAPLRSMEALKQFEIDPIDIVAVNLYPFEQAIANPNCTFENAIENIDIGGPTMIRAAAKNHESVTVIVSPGDYRKVIEEIKEKAKFLRKPDWNWQRKCLFIPLTTTP